MKHVFNLFLLTLCLCVAEHVVRTAPQDNSSSVNQTVKALVSHLKGARSVPFGRTSGTQRLSSARAEGCVLRYELTSEFEQPGGPASLERPHDAVGNIYRIVNEWTADLADLDPAKVRVMNPARTKGGATIFFSTRDGKEAVRWTWQERTRLGVWTKAQQFSGGYFPMRDDGRLGEVAEALRRAITVCQNPAK